jgi:hypothetical protein
MGRHKCQECHAALPTALIELTPNRGLYGIPECWGLSRPVEGFVMKSEKFMRLGGEGGIGPTAVIAEFHFENFGAQDLHNGTHLSADQTGFAHVAHQSNDGEEFEISH